MNQIICINKEKDYTSRDIVNKLIHILGTKKIGHTGTLDPFAEGVLVCLTGKYTKLIPYLESNTKEYIAEIKLGIETDTLDITGTIISNKDIPNIDSNTINKVLLSFLGKSTQVVPIYSAVHLNGKRLYEYARSNTIVDLPKKDIYISNIELISYIDNIIKYKVEVSRGTYIRSLSKDICNKLGTIGTTISLVRTREGIFNIDNSYSIEDIELGKYNTIDIKDILDIKVVNIIDNNLYIRIINGNTINYSYKGFILYRMNNRDIALYRYIDNIGKLVILF